MVPILILIPVASDLSLIPIPVFPKKTLIPILIPIPASCDPDSNKPGFDSDSDFCVLVSFWICWKQKLECNISLILFFSQHKKNLLFTTQMLPLASLPQQANNKLTNFNHWVGVA